MPANIHITHILKLASFAATFKPFEGGIRRKPRKLGSVRRRGRFSEPCGLPGLSHFHLTTWHLTGRGDAATRQAWPRKARTDRHRVRLFFIGFSGNALEPGERSGMFVTVCDCFGKLSVELVLVHVICCIHCVSFCLWARLPGANPTPGSP